MTRGWQWWAVAVGWLVISGWQFAFVYRHAVDCPVADEWMMLGGLVGEDPLGPWLWQRHNEHLYPLPRLVWWGVHQAFAFDFRAPMWVSAAFLSAAAALFLDAARRLRGRTRLTDLLVPALLLHEGHYELTLLGYDLALSLPVLLTAIWIRLAVEDASHRRILATLLLAMLLSLCGGIGVLLAPLVVVWAAYAAWAMRRAAGGGYFILLLFALVALLFTLGYLGWYTTGAPRGSPAFTDVTPTSGLVTASEYLGGAIGPWGHGEWGVWHWERTWPLSAGVAGLLLLGALILLARAWFREESERTRVAALLAVILACLAAGAGVVAYRTGLKVGFCTRYAILGGLMLTAAHLTFARYWPSPTRWWEDTAAVVAATFILVVAARFADPWAKNVYKQHQEALYHQSQADRTPRQLAEKTASWLLVPGPLPPDQVPAVTAGLELLERHRIGCYRWRKGSTP